MDVEWFELHRNGGLVPPDGGRFVNEEAANAAALEAAQDADDAVSVVRCRHTEVRRFQRAVTVSSTDVATAAP